SAPCRETPRRSAPARRRGRLRSCRSWFGPVGDGQRIVGQLPATAERLGQADEGAGALGLSADLRIARRKQLVFGGKQVAEIGQAGLVLASREGGRVAGCVERFVEQHHALVRLPQVDRRGFDFFQRAEDRQAPGGQRTSC